MTLSSTPSRSPLPSLLRNSPPQAAAPPQALNQALRILSGPLTSLSAPVTREDGTAWLLPHPLNASAPSLQHRGCTTHHEKDACGLAMVATLRGTAGHDIIATALEALRNLEHRGAVGSDAGTGDGAGIIPRSRMPSCARSSTSSCPPWAATPSASPSCPSTARARAEVKEGIEKLAAEEDLTVLGWRDVPIQPGELGKLARGAMPAFEQLFLQSSVSTQGNASRHRPRPPDVPPAQARRARASRLLPVAVVPHDRLQGHGHDAPARAVLPRPVRRAVRVQARPRALAVLDEHVPVVAARAAVPHDRAQRRDQHRAGQPQLDARPSVPARVRGLLGDLRPFCRSSLRARATRPRSTRSSSCSPSPAAPCRTRS